jgi:hypothetical protein
VLSVRPKVAELAFQVFGRSLHPELFVTFQSREMGRGDYRVKIDLTSAGHVLTWMHQGVILTEVAASAHHPLPQKRRLISHRLHGKRSDHIEYRSQVRYSYDFELDTVSPDVFWMLQEKLTVEPGNYDLIQRFDSSGRIALGALSFIHLDVRNKTFCMQAMHTFPDDHAIVRTNCSFALI